MLKVLYPPSINKRKTEIELDLKKNPNDPRYTFYIPTKSKSSVWQNFHVVRFNEQPECYAQCKNCKDILSYSTRCGTGSLLRHKCVKRSNNRYTKSLARMDIKNENSKSPVTVQTEETNVKSKSEPALEYENFDKPEELAIQPQEQIEISYDTVMEEEEVNNKNLYNDINPQIHVRDIYDAFGENVANEMRQLRDVEEVQYQLKTAILKSILEANAAAHESRKLRTTRKATKKK